MAAIISNTGPVSNKCVCDRGWHVMSHRSAKGFQRTHDHSTLTNRELSKYKASFYWMAICLRDAASGFLAKLSPRTPLLKSALTLSGSACSGREMTRLMEP